MRCVISFFLLCLNEGIRCTCSHEPLFLPLAVKQKKLEPVLLLPSISISGLAASTPTDSLAWQKKLLDGEEGNSLPLDPSGKAKTKATSRADTRKSEERKGRIIHRYFLLSFFSSPSFSRSLDDDDGLEGGGGGGIDVARKVGRDRCYERGGSGQAKQANRRFLRGEEEGEGRGIAQHYCPPPSFPSSS